MKNLRARIPTFPTPEIGDFKALHQAALMGDSESSDALYQRVSEYFKAVYTPLEAGRGLHFSVRRPVKGYDEATQNYAVNLKEFLDETTDSIRVTKKRFSVTTRNGESFPISYLRYKPSGQLIQTKNPDGSIHWLPLDELCDNDRRFVESAFADEVFDSRQFSISVELNRLEEKELDAEEVEILFDNGQRFSSSSFYTFWTTGVECEIVLENKGYFPVDNLLIEYQAFAEQLIMMMPEDLPEDYRCVGYLEVDSIAPGETKRLLVELPETVEARTESRTSGNTEYSIVFPPDICSESKGRMNGVWVKVHRITPYGERIEREEESAGVPSVKWENIVPAAADIR